MDKTIAYSQHASTLYTLIYLFIFKNTRFRPYTSIKLNLQCFILVDIDLWIFFFVCDDNFLSLFVVVVIFSWLPLQKAFDVVKIAQIICSSDYHQIIYY